MCVRVRSGWGTAAPKSIKIESQRTHARCLEHVQRVKPRVAGVTADLLRMSRMSHPYHTLAVPRRRT